MIRQFLSKLNKKVQAFSEAVIPDELLKQTGGGIKLAGQEIAKAPFRVGMSILDIPQRHLLQQPVQSLTVPGLGLIETYQSQAEQRAQHIVEGTQPLWHGIKPFVQVPLEVLDVYAIGRGAQMIKGAAEDISRQSGKSLQAGFAKLPEKTPVFQGYDDLTTKTLNKLVGRKKVSKQFINDLTNTPDLKQAERDLIRDVLSDFGDDIPVKEFADRVKTRLLPLESSIPKVSPSPYSKIPNTTGRYESITLPDELRGNVANYDEVIYSSPIKTSAGDVHFSRGYQTMAGESPMGSGYPKYFAHTRVEDMADPKGVGSIYKKMGINADTTKMGQSSGSTRRIIELQSDLYQKGGLEKEFGFRPQSIRKTIPPERERVANLIQLKPYQNTWHERIIREEVKRAVKDGKKTLQLPTGKTAMKIEGLGETANWHHYTKAMDDFDIPDIGIPEAEEEMAEQMGRALRNLTKESMKKGDEIFRGADTSNGTWIITEVLEDGKFKAAPVQQLNLVKARIEEGNVLKQEAKGMMETISEQFDISGNIDTANPIYKFYEKEVGRFIKNKFNSKLITDPQGVDWWEIDLTKVKKSAIEAFSIAPILLGAQSITEQNKNGQ